jgi:hypothetical protein
MMDDMPQPRCWVSITVKGDSHFVHVREGGLRDTFGPFASHRDAAQRANVESSRLGLPSSAFIGAPAGGPFKN